MAKLVESGLPIRVLDQARLLKQRPEKKLGQKSMTRPFGPLGREPKKLENPGLKNDSIILILIFTFF